MTDTPTWIAVADELPPDCESVLAHVPGDNADWLLCFYSAEDGSWELDHTYPDIGYSLEIAVTHWMPLPPPPVPVI